MLNSIEKGGNRVNLYPDLNSALLLFPHSLFPLLLLFRESLCESIIQQKKVEFNSFLSVFLKIRSNQVLTFCSILCSGTLSLYKLITNI